MSSQIKKPRVRIKHFARSGDPDTSWAAAAKAARASVPAIQVVLDVFADGVERTDQEIWLFARALGYVSSLDVIQHARLALSNTGMLADTGVRRLTSDGMPSRVWRSTRPSTRGVIQPRTTAATNVRSAFEDASRKLKDAQDKLANVRTQLATKVLGAYANIADAREHGRVIIESYAMVRMETLSEVMDMLGMM